MKDHQPRFNPISQDTFRARAHGGMELLRQILPATGMDPSLGWSRCQLRFFSELRGFFTPPFGTQNLHKPHGFDEEWMINDEWHVLNKAVWKWDLLKAPCIFSCKGTMSVLCVQVTGGVAILTWDVFWVKRCGSYMFLQWILQATI